MGETASRIHSRVSAPPPSLDSDMDAVAAPAATWTAAECALADALTTVYGPEDAGENRHREARHLIRLLASRGDADRVAAGLTVAARNGNPAPLASGHPSSEESP